jgi:hypothetical protein
LKLTLLLLPLLAALMIHLDAWFGHSPLRPGQSTVVAVRISPAAASTLDDWSLDVPPSLTVGTPPLRLASVGEVSWAVRAGQVGKHRLQIRGQGVVVQKTVVVSNRGWDRLAPRSVKGTSWNHLLYPGDADLPEDSPVEWIEVRYPALGVRLLGWEMSWWLLFFLSSCGFGLVASRLMRVTI